MRLSLELIVVVIVILVVAVVVLAIFGSQILNIGPWTDARANCLNMGMASCKSIKELPPTWKTENMHYGEELMSCEQITNKKKCEDFE